MKQRNIFLGALILSIVSIGLGAKIASADTTVIIKNINSVARTVELSNITAGEVNLTDWTLVQQNLPVSEQNIPIYIDLTGSIAAMSDKTVPVTVLGSEGAIFYLYDQLNNLVMSATLALDGSAPVISDVSPASGSRVGSLTTLTFSSTKFNDPSCQVDGLNWGSPCHGSTFASIPGWGNITEGPFILTIKDTDAEGRVGRLNLNYYKDITAPLLVSATAVDGNTINVLFNENLQTDLVASDFMVSGEWGENPVVSATGNGNIITLKVQNAFLNTHLISLDINPFKPISLKDLVGNEFVPASTVSVVNNIPEVVVVNPVVENPSSGGGSSGGGTSGYYSAPVVIPGQVLGATIFKFTKNLSHKQKNSDVLELQKRLMKEGFMTNDTPTDYFGVKTLEGVKLYQKKYKLPITGYVGPMTRSMLNGWFAKNRPENQMASLLEQIQNIQNMINSLLQKNTR